jgi:hypothetical protein
LVIAGACKTATPDEVFGLSTDLPGSGGSSSSTSGASSITGGKTSAGGSGSSDAGKNAMTSGGAAGGEVGTGGSSIVGMSPLSSTRQFSAASPRWRGMRHSSRGPQNP